MHLQHLSPEQVVDFFRSTSMVFFYVAYLPQSPNPQIIVAILTVFVLDYFLTLTTEVGLLTGARLTSFSAEASMLKIG